MWSGSNTPAPPMTGRGIDCDADTFATPAVRARTSPRRNGDKSTGQGSRAKLVLRTKENPQRLRDNGQIPLSIVSAAPPLFSCGWVARYPTPLPVLELYRRMHVIAGRPACLPLLCVALTSTKTLGGSPWALCYFSYEAPLFLRTGRAGAGEPWRSKQLS
ncbi:unnamed protein product [Cutaneotrichosporon oleaginosum]